MEPQETVQRPRTRAWTKQEEQRKEEATVTSSASHQKPGKSSAKQASLSRRAGSSRQPRLDISPPSPSLPLQVADRPAGNTRQREAETRKDPKVSHEERRKRTLRGLHVTEEVVENSPVRPSSVPPPQASHLATDTAQVKILLTSDSAQGFLRGLNSYKLPRLKTPGPFLW